MERNGKFDILQDIATRTAGDIYLGVVGPVRTGKSSFIKRFMELLVLPELKDENALERAQDELPQSAAGRTIMTTEPKFIPAEAAEITISDGLNARFRLVDCVGYAVESALGYQEEDGPRMVNTPWFEDAVPFHQAAEIGTRKVIHDHSTVGIVITTDGSITDIEPDDYRAAEARVIRELKEIGKPFVVVLNSKFPQSESCIALAEELAEQYDAAVVPLNILAMQEDDVLAVLHEVLMEFPIAEIDVELPLWVKELEPAHWLRKELESVINAAVQPVEKLRDVDNVVLNLSTCEQAAHTELVQMDLGTGRSVISIQLLPELFHKVLEEYAGLPIEGEDALLKIVRDFSKAHREWEKMEYAMHEARNGGYGVVTPRVGEMYLEEPELIKQGGRFGVRLKASAPSYHIIRANISTEITPLIGTESQCEELVKYILNEFEEDPQKIWQTNIFGKSLNELVQEGIQGKLYRMPENAQLKLQETLQRIVNEGGGGLICIIL